jgi:hypothetical protein
MKIPRVGAELFHVDRETDEEADMTKLLVAFPKFANARKKGLPNRETKNVDITTE